MTNDGFDEYMGVNKTRVWMNKFMTMAVDMKLL